MDLGLKDRVAIVTGGGRGIGHAEVLALAAEGCRLVVTGSKHPEEAESVAQEVRSLGGQAIALQADVSDSAQVQDMVRHTLAAYGRIDVLVNNAGLVGAPYMGAQVVDLDEKYWDMMLAVHARGTFLCTKYVAPHMIERGWGRIVNTSSTQGRVGFRTRSANYAAAKAAVIAFTQAVARELGPRGITVNAIAPGYVMTELMSRLWSPERVAHIAEQVPVGRWARPEEVANLVVFLASQGASYINGAVLDVNGGRTEYFVE